MDREIQILLLHLLGEQVPHAFEHGAQIRRHKLQLDLAALDAAHLEDVVDQGEKVLAGQIDLCQVFLYNRRIRFRLRQIGIADDRVHGGADIVGHVEQELAFGQAAFDRTDLLALDGFVLFLHDVLNVEHHGQADKDDQEQDEAAPDDGRFHLFGCFSGHQPLSHPHEHGIEEQYKQDHTGGGHAAVFRQGAARNRSPVEHKAQQAPEGKEQERLAAHGL